MQHSTFNITPEKRESRRQTDEVPLAAKNVGPKDKSKAELVEEIMQAEYGNADGRNVLAKKLVRDLHKMAGDSGIDTKKMVTNRKRNGWKNQGKGLLQVLYERGWIDESGVSKYKMRAVYEDGELIPQLLLIHMMET